MLEDPRYRDMNLRHEHRDTLIASIEELTVARPTAHWLRLLEAAGVPCAPIQDYGQVFTDEHLLARTYFWDAPHPTVGPVRQLGSPMRFARTPVRRDDAGPRLGEDSADILSELGYNRAEIDQLLTKGVIGAAETVSSR